MSEKEKRKKGEQIKMREKERKKESKFYLSVYGY